MILISGSQIDLQRTLLTKKINHVVRKYFLYNEYYNDRLLSGRRRLKYRNSNYPKISSYRKSYILRNVRNDLRCDEFIEDIKWDCGIHPVFEKFEYLRIVFKHD